MDKLKKKLLIHLGPHKTGSTAIQCFFNENKDYLNKKSIHFMSSSNIHRAALLLAQGKYQEAESQLNIVAHEILLKPHDQIILSQEDFSGPLVGRGKGSKIYPRLTKHLRIIKRAFSKYDIKFVFFLRNEYEWLRSCYHQNLRYRTSFSDFEQFVAKFGNDFSWETVLKKPTSLFGTTLVTPVYEKDPKHNIQEIFKLLKCQLPPDFAKKQASLIKNASPTADKIKLIEQINRLSQYTATAYFSKGLVIEGYEPRSPMDNFSKWPPDQFEYPKVFSDLGGRVNNRVYTQSQPDLLPSLDEDYRKFFFETLPDTQLPEGVERNNIRDQYRILKYHFRKRSFLSFYNALSISYLRRHTEHTAKARDVFHKIWEVHGVLLINTISTRWLISTLQTFYEHGKNESQRMIGASGYFYGNMIKIYEGERALEGSQPDAVYANQYPQIKSGFRGLDLYRVGGTDLHLNTNAHLLEVSSKDPVAGIVLQELLLRTEKAQTVFSRMDQTRKHKDINEPQFENTWSFFKKP